MESFMKIHQITGFFLLFLGHSLVISFTTIPSNLSSSRYVCDPKDSSALLEFKNTFSLDKSASIWCSESRGQIFYLKTETWNESMDCCSWEGVECGEDGAGQVIGLDVSCNGLSGTIHPNSSLFTLSHLQRLNLAHNHFHFSPISPQFTSLRILKSLNLSHSFLFGDIPLEISQLSNLISLDLSWNYNLKFSNPVLNKLVNNLTNLRDLALDMVNLADIRPTSLMNLSLSLTSLSLTWCELSGDFPNHILSLPNLGTLQVSNNNEVNGYLPKSNWSKSLEILDVHSTNFSRDIPNTISEVKSLKYLDLSSCNFNGTIPESIGNLTQLTTLFLSGNKLNGEIPSVIANLDQLISFDVSYNHLTGPIPNIWTNLHKLTKLDFGSNSFIGQLPNSISNLTQLSYLRASYNFLSGPLPTHIPPPGFLNLLHLDLGNNSLNSTIPTWIFASPRLVHLDLSHNQFIGSTRDFKSISLKDLDLSGNNLQGGFPESIYRQENLSSLKLGSNNLSGVLNLDMLLRIKSLTVLDVSNNNQLLLYSTSNANDSSVNLRCIAMASCKVSEFPYFLRNQKNLTYLDLSNNQIQGKVPNWLSELGALYYLNLSHNLFSGGIEVLPLTKLEFIFLHFNLFKIPISMPPPSIKQFNASNNQFTGNLHTSICQATSLTVLDLSNNTLSGTIPSCLVNMSFLVVLNLRKNNFSGIIPLPPPLIAVFTASNNHFSGKISQSICQATYLAILDLSNNSLSGTIPPCLVNMTSLLVLDLKRNNFSGIIPTIFSKGSPLRNLELNGNQIDGELPDSLLHCENLEILNLGNNKISGTFPHWLEALPNLRVLILRSNRFGGLINNSMNIYSFPKLQIIDLSHNHFRGPLPTKLFQNLEAMKEFEVGKKKLNSSDGWDAFYQDSVVVTLKGLELQLERILTIFKAIDLSNNNFSEKIPTSIGKLISLKGLNFSNNKLTGEIPPSFVKLTNLEWLDLSSNKLCGNIPHQLVDLTFLSTLNLSHNQLSGRIPQGNQFATFGNSSYFGNPGLCGFPLSSCDADKDHRSPPTVTNSQPHEEDFRFINGFWWKLVFMGYGCGMVFGIFVGYVVFRTGRPVWLVAMVEGKRSQRIRRSGRNSRPKKRND